MNIFLLLLLCLFFAFAVYGWLSVFIKIRTAEPSQARNILFGVWILTTTLNLFTFARIFLD